MTESHFLPSREDASMTYLALCGSKLEEGLPSRLEGFLASFSLRESCVGGCVEVVTEEGRQEAVRRFGGCRIRTTGTGLEGKMPRPPSARIGLDRNLVDDGGHLGLDCLTPSYCGSKAVPSTRASRS
jgi:hypothetical protein